MRFRTTLFLILALVIVALLIHFEGGEGDEKPEAASTALFPGVVCSSVTRMELSMEYGLKAVLERDGATGRWKVLEPFRDDARAEQVDQLLNILEENTRERVFVPGEKAGARPDLSTKGLDPPRMSVVFIDARGTHRLNIGVRDPLGAEVFVTVDSDPHLYRTGSNILNFMRLTPEDLRDDRLFRIDPLVVDEVSMEGPEGMVLRARRTLGDWKIVEPIRDDADNGAVQNLVTRLARFKVKNIFMPEAAEVDRAAYGFKDAVWRIALKSGNVERAVVFAPRDLGPGGSVYCLREGEKSILTTPRGDFSRLPRDLDRYRSRYLLPQVRENVRTVTVFRGKETWLRLKREKGQYFFVKAPFKSPADNIVDGGTTPVSLYLSILFSLQAGSFVTTEAGDLQRFGLDAPSRRVQVSWRQGSTARKVELSLAEGEGGDFYALRSDKPRFVYAVKGLELSFLDDDPLLLRDKRVFFQDLLHVRKAEFTLGEKSFAVERSGAGGVFMKDPDNRFQEFMNDMKRERVLRFVPGPSPEDDARFTSIRGRIAYFVEERGKGARMITAEFGGDAGDGIYGRSSDITRGIYVLKRDFFDRFRKLFEGL